MASNVQGSGGGGMIIDNLQITSNSDKLHITLYENNKMLVEIYDCDYITTHGIFLNKEQKEALIKFLTREVEE